MIKRDIERENQNKIRVAKDIEHVVGVLYRMKDNISADKRVDNRIVPGGKVTSSDLLYFLSEMARFSLAPLTHEVNGFEVPAPEIQPPNKNYDHFVPDHSRDNGYYHSVWTGADFQINLLKNGQVFLTAEAAIANQKAQAKINPFKNKGE